VRIGLLLVALLASGCGHEAARVSSETALPTMQVRSLVSESEGACTAPPLLTDAAGTACSADGRWSYALGPSLADLQPLSARFGTDQLGTETFIDVHLDRASEERFARVSGDSIGRRVAVLFEGRVVTSPVIQSRIEGDLQISGEDATLRSLGEALHAAPAPTASALPERSIPILDPALAAEQERVCAAARPRLAPELSEPGVGLVSIPTSALQMAALLAQQGDEQGAAYWRKQPAGEPVFQCSYTRPWQPGRTLPVCPAGQSPVGGPLDLRTFFVDARGHATEWRSLVPVPTGTCAPD
jgi:hypothetical protein